MYDSEQIDAIFYSLAAVIAREVVLNYVQSRIINCAFKRIKSQVVNLEKNTFIRSVYSMTCR